LLFKKFCEFQVKGGDTRMTPLVFVIDSVAERSSTIRYALEHAGYLVKTCACRLALEAALQWRPAALVVALDLPGANGIDLCSSLRECPELSTTGMVVVVNSKLGKRRAVLDASVDACLTMPFAPGEIAVAVNNAIRRRTNSGRQSEASDYMLIINPSTMRVAIGGKEISTTPLEFRLIDYMARHQGQEFTRDALLDAVWGDLLFITPRSVDSCVRRLRRKLEPKGGSPMFLKSIRGVGYKLEAKPIWELDEPCQCATCSAALQRQKQRATTTLCVRN
jgi:DNA-binding response OmpR family regulator